MDGAITFDAEAVAFTMMWGWTEGWRTGHMVEMVFPQLQDEGQIPLCEVQLLRS